MIQVNDKWATFNRFECFIVVAVHVSDEKIKHRHVHQIGQSVAILVWRKVAYIFITVIGITFPSRFSSLVIRSAIGMSIHLNRSIER